jgi:hypothetical protein
MYRGKQDAFESITQSAVNLDLQRFSCSAKFEYLNIVRVVIEIASHPDFYCVVRISAI